jgi:LysR family hydrogen peroxide-inducible transcriptional activator
MNITLRQLEYVVAVDEHRNFQRAADSCFVSQPGLSAQVAQLEGMLGARLFERGRSGVLVTDAGVVAVAGARRVLTEARDLADAVRAVSAPLTGTLKLGVIPTIAPYLLPNVLPSLKKEFPGLRFLLRESQTSVCLEQLKNGELDVVLLALEVDLEGFEVMPLLEDRFLVAMAVDDPLTKKKRVGDSDLENREVLLLEDGHCLRDQALSVCTRMGASEFGDFRAGGLNTLLEMVGQGLGVTLLPQMAVAQEAERRKGVEVRRFRGREPFRTIGLVWRRESARAEEFHELGRALKKAAKP